MTEHICIPTESRIVEGWPKARKVSVRRLCAICAKPIIIPGLVEATA